MSNVRKRDIHSLANGISSKATTLWKKSFQVGATWEEKVNLSIIFLVISSRKITFLFEGGFPRCLDLVFPPAKMSSAIDTRE